MDLAITGKKQFATAVRGNSYTVTQITKAFADWYFTGPKATARSTSNYPALVSKFLNYCLAQQVPVLFGIAAYKELVRKSYVSPVNRFLTFYQELGCPPVVADPEARNAPPAANELILQFLHKAGHLRGDESKATYRKSLNAFFDWLERRRTSGKEVFGFDAVSVEQYITDLRAGRYSAFTINLRLSALKALARFVLENPRKFPLTDEQREGLIAIDKVNTLGFEQTVYKDGLSMDDRDKLIAACEDPETRAMVSLMVFSGLRTVELTRLLIRDLDLQKGVVYVLGKGKYTREAVKLFRHTVESLTQLLILHPDNQPASHVFPGLTTRKVRRITDAVFLKTGLKRKGISAHSLRHTAAQLLLEKGIDGIYVQQHLRHARFDTTQMYTRKKSRALYLDKLSDE